LEELARAIEATELATLLRRSRWAYPAVNSLHVLGVALLVGSVVPMDLRLVGAWRPDIGLAAVLRLLRPVAAAGAGLALATGALLFAVQATDYVGQPLFAVKMALVAAGLGHALAWGGALDGAPLRRQRAAGIFSITVWVGALGCGRMLGYL
jgi:hypothetical protein